MSLEEVTSQMQARIAEKGAIDGKVVKFDFGVLNDAPMFREATSCPTLDQNSLAIVMHLLELLQSKTLETFFV